MYQKIGKYLSYLLRHAPASGGLTLDEKAYVLVADLLPVLQQTQGDFSRQDLETLVAEDGKNRYSFDESGEKLRANQGHSIPVDVELEETKPPACLYHGTAQRFLSSILETGLLPQTRLYVHLSSDVETALCVGKRHGKPVVLSVEAGRMSEEGGRFFRSVNGVWLCHEVPVAYLSPWRNSWEKEGS